MDITAIDGRFLVSAFRLSDWEFEWNDGGLEVWGGSGVTVTTNSGGFIEAVDPSGNLIEEGGDGHTLYVQLSSQRTLLRFKELPDPAMTKEALDGSRRVVTRYLVSDMPYSLGIPDAMDGVIGWMQDKLQEIPEAARAGAKFNFDTSMSYGETYPRIEIYYSEPETDEEVIERVQIEVERLRLKNAAERVAFDKLKAKFA